jgi:hypothetical protein
MTMDIIGFIIIGQAMHGHLRMGDQRRWTLVNPWTSNSWLAHSVGCGNHFFSGGYGVWTATNPEPYDMYTPLILSIGVDTFDDYD